MNTNVSALCLFCVVQYRYLDGWNKRKLLSYELYYILVSLCAFELCIRHSIHNSVKVFAWCSSNSRLPQVNFYFPAYNVQFRCHTLILKSLLLDCTRSEYYYWHILRGTRCDTIFLASLVIRDVRHILFLEITMYLSYRNIDTLYTYKEYQFHNF